MSRSRIKLAVGPAVLLLAIAYLAVGPAAAEQTGTPKVHISFDGRITPRDLPRHRSVPVSLELSGAVYATGGVPPPRLQRIELAFGARGGLETAGLPVCPRARLGNATRKQALERCRAALVGRGEISAEVPFNPVAAGYRPRQGSRFQWPLQRPPRGLGSCQLGLAAGFIRPPLLSAAARPAVHTGF